MASRQYAVPGIGYFNETSPPRNFAVPAITSGSGYITALTITHPGAATGGGNIFVATSIAWLSLCAATAAMIRSLI